ncbi:MAG: histidine phosphatase family protein, partial [Alphaproteobacteria bacterium]|nr:histidine phosphatase family protein [Alphaproteobacteria bacterium]
FDADGRPVNPREVELTPEGRAQAESVARALADVPFDRAVSSGLRRTLETARIVLGRRDIAIEDEPDIKEIRGGRLDDLPREARAEALVRGFDAAGRPGGTWIGGEAFADFARRVTTAFERLVARTDWTHMLCVAHDASNRAILAWASGAPLAALGTFEQDMACLNLIDLDIETPPDGGGSGRELPGTCIARRMVRASNVTIYNPAKLGLHQTSLEQVFSAYAGTVSRPPAAAERASEQR